MRKNLIKKFESAPDSVLTIPGDWFPGEIPANIVCGNSIYLDSSWGFEPFTSRNREALSLGYATGFYDGATFITTGNGKIITGKYCILNGCTLIASELIDMGNFVMIGWGAVVTDNYLCSNLPPLQREQIMRRNSRSPMRELPFSDSEPVIIKDNVWIGFDAVILPGTTIGRGSIIGCKTVVSGDVPEYSVVVGNPSRIVYTLEPTDRDEAMNQHIT